jgi:hypothetical protein
MYFWKQLLRSILKERFSKIRDMRYFCGTDCYFCQGRYSGSWLRSGHIDPDGDHHCRTVGVRGLDGQVVRSLWLSSKTWLFLGLSDLATGASWVCYFRALKIRDASKVVPVDKLSLVLAALFAFTFLDERPHCASCQACDGRRLQALMRQIEQFPILMSGLCVNNVSIGSEFMSLDTFQRRWWMLFWYFFQSTGR